MTEKLVHIFERVQKIPYMVCKFDKSMINKEIEFGDCRHKSELLYHLLRDAGYKVKRVKVIFDWRDLPLSDNLLDILKKSGSLWVHDSLKVKISNKWVKVDCTWNPELGNKGFPVTKRWDGKTDTMQVVKGNMHFYNPNSKIYLKEKERIKIDKEEAHKFAEALNKYLLG